MGPLCDQVIRYTNKTHLEQTVRKVLRHNTNMIIIFWLRLIQYYCLPLKSTTHANISIQLFHNVVLELRNQIPHYTRITMFNNKLT